MRDRKGGHEWDALIAERRQRPLQLDSARRLQQDNIFFPQIALEPCSRQLGRFHKERFRSTLLCCLNNVHGISAHPQHDIDIAGHALPSYVFITPNLDDDMHDGSISQGDSWLASEVPKLLATDNYKSGGVIFLLWDEGGGSPASDDPPFMAISPNAAHGRKSQTDYDTSSYLLTVQRILGLQPLPCATAADRNTTTAMADLFTVPLTGT